MANSTDDRLNRFVAERRAELNATETHAAGRAAAEGATATKRVVAKWEDDKKVLQRVVQLLNEKLGEFGIKIGAPQFKAGNGTPVSASVMIAIAMPKEGERVLSFNVFAAGTLKAYFQTARKGESGNRIFDIFQMTESAYRDVVLDFLDLP